MQHPSSAPAMDAPDTARYSDGSNFSDDDAGIFMTIDNKSGTEFFAIEPPRGVLTKDSSQNERQISVDPYSLQGSATIRQASFRLVSPPVSSKKLGPNDPPSPLPPPKLKFVSTSLPSSTSSSPESLSFKKTHKNHDQGANRNNLARMQSVMDDTHLAMVEANTRKSKSLGEGRTSGPADDFDLWLEKSNQQNSKRDQRSSSSNNNNNDSGKKLGGSSKPPLGPGYADRHNSMFRKSKTRDPNNPEDKFKCGKLCLFLPRGKGKAVRSISSTSTISQASCKTEPMAISRRVSLEKFECGSWASSLENEEGESANLFFDLPMEMLRCSVSDMQSPVTAAFVFDNDDDNSNGNGKEKKDRDVEVDFHAFLEAQS